MEDLGDTGRLAWPVSRFALAARHLGRFGGLYLAQRPVPDHPWMLRALLRERADRNAPFWDGMDQIRGHPLLPARLARRARRPRPSPLRGRHALLDVLDRLPQTLQHGDADRRNLLDRGSRGEPSGRAEAGGDAETVAIDWAFTGIGPVGQELAPLVVSSALWFAEVSLADLPALDRACFAAYVDGLRDAGWQGDAALARLGYTATCALRYGPLLGSVGLVGASRRPARPVRTDSGDDDGGGSRPARGHPAVCAGSGRRGLGTGRCSLSSTISSRAESTFASRTFSTLLPDVERSRHLLRLMGYMRQYRRLAVLAYGSLFVATAAQLLVPYLVQIIVDAVVAGSQVQADAAMVGGLLASAMLAIVVFSIVRAVFAFGQQYNAERISQNVAFDVRNALFAKIQRQSFSYLDRTQTGQLMVRATDDVEKVRMFVGQGLIMALQSLVLLIATLVVLWFSNRQLTLVVLPILPIAFVVFFAFGAIAQPLFMSVQIRLSALNTVVQENVAGLRVVRAFGREPHEQARFDASADALMQQQLKVARTFSFLFPLVFLISSLGQAAVLYFGGRLIIGGSLSLGEWQKFSLYLAYLFFPLGQLGFIINLMSQATASAERIFDILDASSEIQDRPGAIALSARFAAGSSSKT